MSAACDEGYVLHRCQSVTDDTFKQILSLEKKCFTKADSWRGDMAVELKHRNTFVVCLLRTGEPHVLAYLLYGIRGLSAHIARLAVCPQHRRRGHASRLLRMVLAELRVKRRVHTASLHVAATNGPARALYLKHGFKDDALLEDYYAPGRHAYKMILDHD